MSFLPFYISFICCMTKHHWSNFRSIRTTKYIIIKFRSIKYINTKRENKNQFFFVLTQIFEWIYWDTFVCVYVRRKMLNMAKQKRAMAKYLLVSSWEFALSDHGREGGVLPFHFLVCVYEMITKHSSIMHSLLNRLSHIL